MSSKLSKKDIAEMIQSLCVLVVDDNQYMRKMIRNLLVNCGVKDIYEAGDGIAALDIIRTVESARGDPRLGDAAVERRRTGAHRALAGRVSGAGRSHHHAQRPRRALARGRGGAAGVNEYLVKPVSAKSLYDRLVSIVIQPRPVVQLGDYYGPEPRKIHGIEPGENGPLLEQFSN